MKLHVRMFSAGDCSYCTILKEYLDEKGIYCENIKIDDDNKSIEMMDAENGDFTRAPFFIITQDDGTQIMVKSLGAVPHVI
ncbi:hypothetical protein HY439_00730 [Candidatus Microgenomates bacterium]|nr:hypothetical protein [Candidatus Microgenomates bacterium]